MAAGRQRHRVDVLQRHVATLSATWAVTDGADASALVPASRPDWSASVTGTHAGSWCHLQARATALPYSTRSIRAAASSRSPSANRTWQAASIARSVASSGRSRCSAKPASIESRRRFPAHAQASTARHSPRRGRSTPRGGTATPSAPSTDSAPARPRKPSRRRAATIAPRRISPQTSAHTCPSDSVAPCWRFARLVARPAAPRAFGASSAWEATTATQSPGTFGDDAISLLRGFQNGEFAGTHVALANLEARIPLGWPQRGWGPWPIFLRNVHATAFADVGHAWRDTASWADAKVGAGGELSTDVVVFFGVPLTWTAGVAWGHDGAGAVPDQRSVYFRVGRSF